MINKEKDYSFWHPLTKYIKQVLDCYYIAIYKTFYKTDIKKYEKYKNNTNFKEILTFIKECCENENSVYYNNQATLDMLKIFDALDINCYKGFALFKYKNYVELAQMELLSSNFWHIYNGVYKECRSVVFDIKNQCIALCPQAKFFNLNENEEWNEKIVRKKLKDAKLVEITNKLDGSNQNFRYYNGEIIGAGTSALNTEESWRLKKGYSLLTDNYRKMMMNYPDYTFMFEFISPKNQIVVKYTKEQEGLYLFGMRNVLDGKELSYAEVCSIAKEYGVKTTEIYQETFDEILNQVNNYKSDEKEGWVIGIHTDDDEGIFKVKVKTTDYIMIHKVLTKMVSPNAIIQAIAENKYDDLYAKIPDIYKEDANVIKNKVYKYLNYTNIKIGEYLKQVTKDLTLEERSDRKTFMLCCEKNVPKKYRQYIVARYDNKEFNLLKKGIVGYKKLNELTIDD